MISACALAYSAVVIITGCIMRGLSTSRTMNNGRTSSLFWAMISSSEKPASTAPLPTAEILAPRSPAGTSLTCWGVMPLAFSAIRISMLLTEPGAVYAICLPARSLMVLSREYFLPQPHLVAHRPGAGADDDEFLARVDRLNGGRQRYFAKGNAARERIAHGRPAACRGEDAGDVDAIFLEEAFFHRDRIGNAIELPAPMRHRDRLGPRARESPSEDDGGHTQEKTKPPKYGINNPSK